MKNIVQRISSARIVITRAALLWPPPALAHTLIGYVRKPSWRLIVTLRSERFAADPSTDGFVLGESSQQVQQRVYPRGQHEVHGAFGADTDHGATR